MIEPWSVRVYVSCFACYILHMGTIAELSRRRLFNVIRYFARNTEYCGKVKLFKLLYLLDFQHVAEIGKPVTGLNYEAWKFGPVPVEVMQMWEDFESGPVGGCYVTPESVQGFVRQTVKVLLGVCFEQRLFSRRELRIMQELAEKYRQTVSPMMIDVAQKENGAWAKVWRDGKGAFQVIPYRLAIGEENPHADTLRAVQEDYQARQDSIEEMEFQQMVQRGTAAWSGVTHASDWVETLRGNRE